MIVTEGSELKCSDVFLKEKEAHKFIKEVVKAGKVREGFKKKKKKKCGIFHTSVF